MTYFLHIRILIISKPTQVCEQAYAFFETKEMIFETCNCNDIRESQGKLIWVIECNCL